MMLFTLSAVSANDVDNTTLKDSDIANSIQIDDSKSLSESVSSLTQLDEQIQSTSSGNTITLNQNYMYSEGDNDTGIVITKDITIDGAKNTINGVNKASIFKITNNAHVTLKNILFLNTYGVNGSAVIAQSGSFDIIDCEFVNCEASDYGGAVYSSENCAKSTIVNSSFINNKALYGGAAYLGNIVQMTYSSFINNFATYDGGAILWTGVNGTVYQSRFINNNASLGDGGAINFHPDTSDIFESINVVNNSMFSNNAATFDGGALYCQGLFAMIYNSQFTFDVARNGASIYLNDGAAINHCYFFNETAHNNGGAFYLSSSPIDLTSLDYNANIFLSEGGLKNSIITNCSAGYDGGAGYVAGDFVRVDNVTYINNTAGHDGGAGYILSDYATLTNSIFIHNTATRDGGAIMWAGNNGYLFNINCTLNSAEGGSGSIALAGNNTVITNSVFRLTEATRSGGAIYIYGENATVSDSEFVQSQAVAEHGGAIYIEGLNAVIERCDFNMNMVNPGAGCGGAIYIHGNKSKIRECSFDRCQAFEGGFIYVGGNEAVIENIYGIRSFAANGGAFYVMGNKVEISNSNLALNNATRFAGAIYVAGDDTNITNISASQCIVYGGDGGAIYIKGQNTTISESQFVQNRVLGNNRGGSIFIQGNSTNILNSTFDMCTAYEGGVMYINGSHVLIEDYSCIRSFAYNDGGAIYVGGNHVEIKSFEMALTNATNNGGAIYISGDHVNISNDSFSTCIAANGNGGAVYVGGHNVTITDSSFDRTQAPNGYGGAVYIEGVNALVENSNFTHSFANYGGVLFIAGDDAKIINDTIRYVWAFEYGGAIYVSGDNALLDSNIFEYTNVSAKTMEYSGSGGAIFIWGDNINVTSSIFNTCIAEKGGTGGAICIYGANVNIEYSNFTNCSAPDYIENDGGAGSAGALAIGGDNLRVFECNFSDCFSRNGGVAFIAGSNTEIINCNIINNTADLDGGALYIFGSDTHIYNTTFTNCSTERIGGAIFILLGENTFIEESKFYNCTSEDGGAIYIEGNYVTISESILEDCHASRDGGAVYVKGDYATITDSNFAVCSSDNGNGGAIYYVGSHGTVENSTFINNTASMYGGAAFLHDNNNVTFKESKFTYNAAGLNGGAINFYNGATNGNIFDSVFENNTANRSGGAVFWSGINGTVTLSNFTNNHALGTVTDEYGGGDGGAILWVGHDGNIEDSIFKDNNATYRGGAVFLKGSDDGTSGHCDNVVIRNGLFENNVAGTNGGAVDFQEGARNGAIYDSVFNNNTALRSAGAVYWHGTNGTIANSNFTNNRALGNHSFKNDPRGGSVANYTTAGGNGGAIVWTGTQALIDNSNFINNTASRLGGSIYIQDNANTTIQNTKFINNSAGINGGAVDFNRGAYNGTILNSTFDNNIANRSGGAVFWFGTKGTIRDSNFTNNTALGIINYTDSHGNITYGGYGGAVIWTGDEGLVDNCRFIDNYAQYNEATKSGGRGGAVYLQGSDVGKCSNTTFSNSVFINNTAGFNGGAVDWYRGAENGNVVNSTFINNTAHRSGGGIYWSGVNGTIRNSTFINNTALGEITDANGGGDGGAVLWVGHDGNIEDSIFKDNNATYRGGAVFLKGSDDGTSGHCDNVVIRNGLFENNVAGTNGGAVDFQEGARNGAIYDSVFNNNTAFRSAGAVYWHGTNGTIVNSNFTNNRALGNYSFKNDPRGGSVANYTTVGGNGGAIVWTGTQALIDNSNFINNTASRLGGSIYIQDNANTTIQNSKFLNNTAGINGGAVDFNRGAHEGAIINSTFENNTANRSGGAVFWFGTNGTIKGSNFTNNKALGIVNYTDSYGNITYGGYGGAVIWTGSYGLVDGCQFINNYAQYNEATKSGGRGGAVYLQGSDVGNCYNTAFTNSLFINNTAGFNGGAVDWYRGAANGTVENSTFINNTAKRSGGAIYWSGHDGEVINSEFYNNTASGELIDVNGGGSGGAIIWVGTNGIIDNSKFINNTANASGGAIFLEGSDVGIYENCENVSVSNSIFENNLAGLNGGAVDWSSGAENGAIFNSSFTNNTAWRNGGAVFWHGTNGTVLASNFTNNKALGLVDEDARGVRQYIDENGAKILGGSGGAIAWTGDIGSIDNSNFINNTAKRLGGAVFLRDNSNTVFTNDKFINNTAGINGGAVDFNRGAHDGAIINSTFENNVANRSAGAVFWFGTNGKLINSVFTNNSALGLTNYTDSYGEITYGGNGGAVIWTGNQGIAQNCTFQDNKAAKNGGAVYLQGSNIEDSANTTFDGCSFTNNFADVNGGAIDWYEGAHDGNILNSNFVNNTAKSNGGAVFWCGHNGKIANSNFTNNTALGLLTDSHGNKGDGGAIIWSGINGTVNNCRFIDNEAADRGGAVFLQNCSHGNCDNTTFANVYFANNTAGTNGGALDWHEGAHNGLVDNGTFINNTARAGNGGAVFWSGSNGIIENSVYTQNHAVEGGAVYWNSNTDAELNNLIFTQNTAEKGSAIYVAQGSLNLLDSLFLDNRADSVELKINTTYANDVVEITAEFKGGDNLINAIWNEKDIIRFKNVTYLGEGGITNTGNEYRTPIILKDDEKPTENGEIYQTQYENYQNITVYLYDDANKLIVNTTVKTNISGAAKLTYETKSKVYELLFHPQDMYYTGIYNSTSKLIPGIEIYVNDIKYLENESVIITVSANGDEIPTGNIELWLNDKFINNYTLTDGKTEIITLTDLNTGTYNVTVKYSGDEKFLPFENKTQFIVNKLYSFVNIIVENYNYGETGKIIIQTPGITNTVEIMLNNKTYYVKINETGYTEFIIPKLDCGVYKVDVIYPEVEYYLKSVNSTTFEIYPIVNLTVVKSANVGEAYVGDTVQFTIIVSNEGQKTAKDVKITDDISKFFEYISGDAVNNNGILEWNIDEIAPNGNVTIVFTAKIKINSTLTNVVWANSTDDNAQSNEVTIVASPIVDLTGEIKVNTISALVGDEIEYTITVSNNGPSTATNVKVTDKLLDEVILTDAQTDKGNYESDGVWYVGNLACGENATLTLKVKLLKSVVVENSISVTSDQKDLNESNNNYTSDNVTVDKKQPTFEIKDLDNVDYGQDQQITITLPKDATGQVNVTVDGELYDIVTVENGIAKITLTGIAAGNHDIGFEYSGDDTYLPDSASDKFSISKITPTIKIEVIDILEGDIEVLNVTVNAPGSVNITVDGITVEIPLDYAVKSTDVLAASNVPDYDGKATWRLINLAKGTYTAFAIYAGNENYTSVNTSEVFNVKGNVSNVNVNVPDIKVGQILTVTVTYPSDATGNVTITVNGKNYTQELKDGKAVVTIPNLKSGQYPVTVTYSGNDIYMPNTVEDSFEVSKVKPDIKLETPEIQFGDGEIRISVPDDATGTVTIEIDGKQYTAEIKDGVAIFTIPGLTAGIHDIGIYYSGDEKYLPVNFTGSVKVNPLDENKTDNKTSKQYVSGSGLSQYSTGNPILTLLFAVLLIGVGNIRQFKK